VGVSEYLTVIKTLRDGVEVEDVERCKHLCRLLWAKSREDQDLFDVAFAQFVEQRLQTTFAPEPYETPQDDTSPDSSLTSESTQEEQLKPESEGKSAQHGEKVLLGSTSFDRSLALGTDLTYKPIKYHLTPRLHLGRREMTEALRHLRQLQRTGPPEELDVEGTIDEICRTGVFLHPALQPRRRNQAKLVLLIDRMGSMVPFDLLVETLVESILRGGLLGGVSLYYFHDCPQDFLFEHPSLTDPLSLEEVLASQAKGNSVLVVSDAGAARGDYYEQRLEDTRAFLKVLNTYSYLKLLKIQFSRGHPGHGPTQ